MIGPRILGFVALATLLGAATVGRRTLGGDPALRKVIGVLLFCSLAGLLTSYIRAPLIIWPLGLSILAALTFLVWATHVEQKRKRDRP